MYSRIAINLKFVYEIPEALSWVVELSQTYGRVFRVWFAEQLTIFVSDPDYLKVCLQYAALIIKSNMVYIVFLLII